MLQNFSRGSIAAEFPPLDIARVETWITRPAKGDHGFGDVKPCLFVRLTSHNGVEGWGEGYVLDGHEPDVAGIIHTIAPGIAALDAITPWGLRDLVSQADTAHLDVDYAGATSAIEMAVWDMIGQVTEKPLYALLGAAGRRDLSIYSNIWSDTQWTGAELAERAVFLIEQGYDAVKIHPLHNHTEEQAIEAVHMIRGAIGPEPKLMVDLDSNDDVELALTVAAAIKPDTITWLEEPADGTDIKGLARIRREAGLPVVTGEKQTGVAHFKTLLAHDAADILNPDIAGVGGLLDMLEIAGLADGKGVVVSPHCWNSMTVAASAMMHFCTVIPNPGMAEIYPENLGHGSLYASAGFEISGPVARTLDRPGLGVSINTAALDGLSSQHDASNLAARRMQ